MNLMIAQVILIKFKISGEINRPGEFCFFSLIYVWVGTVNYTNKSS